VFTRTFSIYRRVVLPLAKPVIATVIIFSFLRSWMISRGR